MPAPARLRLRRLLLTGQAGPLLAARLLHAVHQLAAVASALGGARPKTRPLSDLCPDLCAAPGPGGSSPAEREWEALRAEAAREARADGRRVD